MLRVCVCVRACTHIVHAERNFSPRVNWTANLWTDYESIFFLNPPIWEISTHEKKLFIVESFRRWSKFKSSWWEEEEEEYTESFTILYDIMESRAYNFTYAWIYNEYQNHVHITFHARGKGVRVNPNRAANTGASEVVLAVRFWWLTSCERSMHRGPSCWEHGNVNVCSIC